MITQDEIIYFKNSGRMNKNLILVENNPMDIPNRIREIDPGYFVMFNPGTQQYEIHHREQDYTLALNLPYRELDNRAIIVLNNTRIENAQKILEDIESHNEKLEADKHKKLQDEIGAMARDVHTYCLRHVDKETPGKDAYTTKFI